MLVDETTQTHLQRKAFSERSVKEGVELWRKQKDQLRLQKLKEQQEMRKLLENYWPFGRSDDIKPRGLRNLRLEGLFPNKDFLHAKRFVGTLDLGRPGGGAPLVTDTGKKVTRTREDPLLRFQFGSHDLRKCVDNTLRYKTNRQAQEKYKKELDNQIVEKKRSEEKQKQAEQQFEQKQFLISSPWSKRGPGGLPWRSPKSVGHNFFKSLGWSDENALKDLNEVDVKITEEKSGHRAKARKLDPLFYPCKNLYTGSKSKKLSPLLTGKENGIELVPLLARQRRFPLKIHLDSTDVTNERKIHFSSLWNREGSAYLRELTKQMSVKQEKLKEMKAEEERNVQRHFSTWDGFWGRPGHGAPRSAIKKQRLDRLLYPQMVPFIFLVLAAVYAKEEENNEVTPPKPPINLDANLRRALLKALTELENEENEKVRQQSLSQSIILPNLPHLDTRDKIIEKASASALSFFASADSSTTTTEKLTTTTEKATHKPIVIIQRSKGIQHKPITILDQVNDPEQILTSASSSFTLSNKFAFGKDDNLGTRSANLVQEERKTPKIEATTVTTITSTEESEAKVEDVQFFSAPLVAAFTVHQDERGLPKSVEPIFRSVSPKVEVKPTTKPSKVSTTTDRQQAEHQLILQEKQRTLEEEIFRLKQQQQQHNYFIRQQQLLHEQQLQLQKQKLFEEEIRIRNSQQREQPLQFQKHNFLEDENRIRNNQQTFQPLVNTNFNNYNNNNNNQFRNNFNNNSRVKGSLVSFQPSISFGSNQQIGTLPLNGQQLPIKNAIDFRTPLPTVQPNFPHFNYLSQQHLPPSNFNIAPSIQNEQLPITNPNHHRVFRQESNVGNVFNPDYNNYFNQNQQQQQNRFFRSNAESFTASPYNLNRIQSPVVNQHLNNLLYNSGFRDKQHEDLNIVSKVLSLNHRGGDYRFGSSNINEQRVSAPFIKKV